ncbi:MAG: YchF/TatD family DNA exonuclease [candidate division Zixibacteria bacterium]|nr:YchF/TatD family DNA exonuclease [candidate division Zixibacteria bacterium]
MIDTHTHLDFSQFDSDRDDVIKQSRRNGLKFMVNIGVDLATSKASIELAEKYKFIYATVGYHPHDSKDLTDSILAEIKEMAKHPKVVAIGEIGLDFYRNISPQDIQKEAFIKQLDLADELNLPVVLHIRQALDEAYEILSRRKNRRGILHAFPGDEPYAADGIKMGYHIAFGGPITYPKSKGARVAGSVPSSRIVTETDCPYLPPQKYRGKRNQPDYIRYVIDKLTEVFPKYSYDDIERITELNAGQVFKMPVEDDPRVVYRIGDSLYINLTMRCTNNCYFCPKNRGYHVAGHNLLLNREPGEDEIIQGIAEHKDFKEIVFCGLGEPTLRADLILSLADKLKSYKVPLRLNTNGQGSLINKTDLPAKLAGIIDMVSVSLNAENSSKYAEISIPQFGQSSYTEVIKFAGRCKELGLETQFSVVEIPEIEVEECRKVAEGAGIPLRVRKYVAI